MQPAIDCEEKRSLTPIGLILVNWKMVLIGIRNKSSISRWSYNLLSCVENTNIKESRENSLFASTDKPEVAMDVWSIGTMSCGCQFSDYILMHDIPKGGFMFQLDSPSSKIGLATDKYVMVQALARPVWYSLFAILVLISFMLHAVLRREEAVVHAGSEAPPWETSEVLLVTIGAICQQEYLQDNEERESSENQGLKIVSLSINEAYPAFMLLIYGTVAAMILLIIETLQYKNNLQDKPTIQSSWFQHVDKNNRMHSGNKRSARHKKEKQKMRHVEIH